MIQEIMLLYDKTELLTYGGTPKWYTVVPVIAASEGETDESLRSWSLQTE